MLSSFFSSCGLFSHGQQANWLFFVFFYQCPLKPLWLYPDLQCLSLDLRKLSYTWVLVPVLIIWAGACMLWCLPLMSGLLPPSFLNGWEASSMLLGREASLMLIGWQVGFMAYKHGGWVAEVQMLGVSIRAIGEYRHLPRCSISAPILVLLHPYIRNQESWFFAAQEACTQAETLVSVSGIGRVPKKYNRCSYLKSKKLVSLHTYIYSESKNHFMYGEMACNKLEVISLLPYPFIHFYFF